MSNEQRWLGTVDAVAQRQRRAGRSVRRYEFRGLVQRGRPWYPQTGTLVEHTQADGATIWYRVVDGVLHYAAQPTEAGGRW